MALVDVSKVERLIKNYLQARKEHDWEQIECIRETLTNIGVVIIENLDTNHLEWFVRSDEKV